MLAPARGRCGPRATRCPDRKGPRPRRWGTAGLDFTAVSAAFRRFFHLDGWPEAARTRGAFVVDECRSLGEYVRPAFGSIGSLTWLEEFSHPRELSSQGRMQLHEQALGMIAKLRAPGISCVRLVHCACSTNWAG